MNNNNILTNFQSFKLDDLAKKYQEKKSNIHKNYQNIDKIIEVNTKKETENVKSAIKKLDNKVKVILERDDVKKIQKNIENDHKIMSISIKVAKKKFKKYCKHIEDSKEYSKSEKDEKIKQLGDHFMKKMYGKDLALFQNLLSNILVLPGNNFGGY